MGRYLGSKHKLCRRVGEKLCTSDKCPSTRRTYAPGVHGPSAGRVKLTSFGIQHLEKQKAKWVYGLLERQFENYVGKAVTKTGDSGENLLRLLEGRLDNVAFRLGFAKTRDQARQFITHGWFKVNGKKLTIPSYQVKIDDTIEFNFPKAKPAVAEVMKANLEKAEPPRWLGFDKGTLIGKVLSVLKKDDLQTNFDTKLIIEFYSR